MVNTPNTQCKSYKLKPHHGKLLRNYSILHYVSVLTLKYPLRFDNKFVQTWTNDKFITQTRPYILRHN